MNDQDIRARTLIQTAAGKLKKLQEVVEYIAAEETEFFNPKISVTRLLTFPVSGSLPTSEGNHRPDRNVVTVVIPPILRTHRRRENRHARQGLE